MGKLHIGIVHFLELDRPTGSSVYVKNLVQSLAKMNFNVTIICRKSKYKIKIKGVHIREVDIYPFQSWKECFAKPGKLKKAINDFAKELKNIDNHNPFDLVHIQHAIVTPEIVEKSGINCAKIMTIHGSETHECPSEVKRIESVIGKMNKVIIVGKGLFDSLWKPSLKEKLVFIPPGIDSTLFSPKKNRVTNKLLARLLKQKMKIILFVGRLVREKGIYEMLNVFRVVKEKNEKVCLVICGEGIEKNKLATHIKKRNYSDVFLVGGISQEELPQFYTNSSVFIAPYVWDEPFGITILEAFSCGTPSVINGVGELKTWKTKIPLIVVSNPPNWELFSKKILNEMETPSYKPQYLRKLSYEYSWQRIASIIGEIYEKNCVKIR